MLTPFGLVIGVFSVIAGAVFEYWKNQDEQGRNNHFAGLFTILVLGLAVAIYSLDNFGRYNSTWEFLVSVPVVFGVMLLAIKYIFVPIGGAIINSEKPWLWIGLLLLGAIAVELF